jgi:protein-disulfide isomerase
MSKTFWAIIAVIILIFVGIVVFKDDKAAAPTGSAKPTSHLFGQGTSGVTLVEYGDYQCQFCAQYHPLVNAVKEKYKEQIHFQYRNLPLLQVHKNAFAAARAAEAADKQGKFWEMYDLLFQNQSAWSESSTASTTFEQYAAQLSLNVTQFKKDASSAAVNDIINADINEFKKTKEAMSTPTFFLEGKKVQPKSVDEFSKLIDEAIKAKSQQ